MLLRSVALAMLLVLAACDDHTKSGDGACVHNGTSYAVGEVFPVGDGCNSCTCTTSGLSCTMLTCADAGVDANPAACGPFGGCPEGPACGTLCCNSGEHCMNGTCQCGTGPACTGGNTCERGGPAGGDLCGTLCCGVTGPCPQ